MNLYKCSWAESYRVQVKRGVRKAGESKEYNLLILATSASRAKTACKRMRDIFAKIEVSEVRSEADLDIEEKMYPVMMVEHEGDYLSGYFGKEKQIRKWRLPLMNPDGSKPHLIDVLRQQWAKSDQHRAELEEILQMKLPLGNPYEAVA